MIKKNYSLPAPVNVIQNAFHTFSFSKMAFHIVIVLVPARDSYCTDGKWLHLVSAILAILRKRLVNVQLQSHWIDDAN